MFGNKDYTTSYFASDVTGAISGASDKARAATGGDAVRADVSGSTVLAVGAGIAAIAAVIWGVMEYRGKKEEPAETVDGTVDKKEGEEASSPSEEKKSTSSETNDKRESSHKRPEPVVVKMSARSFF